MPTARLIMSRQQLEAENRELRAQIAVARAWLLALQGAHDWEHELHTQTYRCTVCGMRARHWSAVTISCEDILLDARKRMHRRHRTS